MARHGVRVGVVLSDTAGRAWRVGQVDFALGAHGLRVLDDLRGGTDADGKPLEVTTRAVADEIAAAADLAKGKVAAVPAAVLRGVPGVLVDEPLESRTRADATSCAPAPATGSATAASRPCAPRSASSRAARRPRPSAWRPPATTRRLDAVSRAVRAALHGVESGTADVGRLSVTLGADSPYELGQLVARLRAALWCEWLVGEADVPVGRRALGGRPRLGQRTPA